MNADRLLAHYERMADAPDAIPRLRRFVLDLAVRGKLVPQDPRDEPASELLKRIAREKKQLLQTGGIRKADAEVESTAPLGDMQTPSGWITTTLQSICRSLTDGDHLPPPKSDDGVPFLVIGNVRHQRVDFTDTRYVPMSYYQALDNSRRPQAGDLLYTLVGSFGIPVIVRDNRQFCVQRHIGILRPMSDIDVTFLARLMESSLGFEQAVACATGIAQKTVPLSGLRRFVLPFPSLAEQHRIVAKVDELMALCDRLAAARAEREEARDRLAAASLARLNAPDPDPAAFVDHAAFALNNIAALTTRPDQVKQLRQTILNLAVRGRLVPQDPNEEPTLVLLERIANERSRLIRAGQIRKGNPSQPISTDELPFGLPRGWGWTRLGSLIHLISGQHLQPSEYSYDPKAGVPYITGPADFGANGLQISRFALVRKAIATKGQLLLTVKGSGVGKTTTCDIREVAISRQLMALTAIAWDARFLVLVTHRLAERLQKEARSLIPGISREDVEEFVFPLPPLPEQHRIVAKVDELMALCHRLEASLAAAQTGKSRLLNTVLHEALTAAA